MSYVAKATAVVLVVIGLFGLAMRAQDVLLLILASMVLAVGLEPAVRLLMRLHFSRGLAVCTVFLAAIVSLVVAIMLLGPMLITQAEELAKAIPNAFNRAAQSGGLLGDIFGNTDFETAVKGFISDAPDKLGSSVGDVLGITAKVGGAIFGLFTIAILTIYLMLSLPKLRDASVRLFPSVEREDGKRVIDRSISKIGGYVCGMGIISLISAVVAGIALWLLGVPYPVPLAIWAGVASIIPVIGAYIGGAPAVLVAFTISPLTGILTIVFFVVWQQIRDYVVSPPIMRDAVDLSPALVVIATLIGGRVAGFFGILLALPIAATIKVVLQQYWRRDEESPEG
jgi:predicted PurR-regulated permease PerM